MKKLAILSLAAGFIFATSTAFAAVNPFADVPAKHWAYNAVSQLAKDGIVDGYNSENFLGDKTMTRYEMAQVVGKAVYRADKANAEDRKLIDKLSMEFAAELNNLGVRVSDLEKNASPVKLNMYARERFEFNKDNIPATVNANDQYYRYRLIMTTKLDNNFKFVARYGNDDNSNSANTGSNQASPSLQQAYATGKVGEVTANIGRQPLYFGKGLTMDISTGWDGISLQTGTKLKVKAGWVQRGFNATNTTYGSPLYIAGSAAAKTSATEALAGERTFYFADAGYTVSPNFDVTATYLKDNGLRTATIGYAKSIYNTYAVGATYKIGDKVAVTAEYAKNRNNDALTDAKASYAQVKYGAANFAKVGTWGTWVQYRKADKGFDPVSLSTMDYTNKMFLAGGSDNVKGFEFAVEYAAFANSVTTLKYWDLMSNDGNNKKHKAVLLQLEFKM